MPTVPSRIVIEIPAAEQADLLRQLRRARWGSWLLLHIVLLLAQQRAPIRHCRLAVVLALDRLCGGQQGRRPW